MGVVSVGMAVRHANKMLASEGEYDENLKSACNCRGNGSRDPAAAVRGDATCCNGQYDSGEIIAVRGRECSRRGVVEVNPASKY